MQGMLERTHRISGRIGEQRKGCKAHEGQASQTEECLEDVQATDCRQGYEGQEFLAPNSPGGNNHGGKNDAIDEEFLGCPQAEDPPGVSRQEVGAGTEKARMRVAAGVLQLELQRVLGTVC